MFKDFVVSVWIRPVNLLNIALQGFRCLSHRPAAFKAIKIAGILAVKQINLLYLSKALLLTTYASLNNSVI